MMKPEIVYQSKETTPLGDPFMTVKKADGYYYYAERGGQDSVFFILYDRDTSNFALISESKPPLNEMAGAKASMTTAFGGSIDMVDTTNKEIVRTEVLEEAGYVVPLDRIHYCGKTMVSTQMSQFAHGYLVDVTGISKTHKTESEMSASDNFTWWTTMDHIISNSDWKSMFIVLKAQWKELL